MDKMIFFDMDGTIADLYAVSGWLDDLRHYRERPYAQAKPLYEPSELIAMLYLLKKQGYKLGIISWLSKDSSNKDYNKRVRQAKRDWLKRYELLELFDTVRITPYGVCKSTTCKRYSNNAILVDDEQQNRDNWKLGETIDANKDILEILKSLLDN